MMVKQVLVTVMTINLTIMESHNSHRRSVQCDRHSLRCPSDFPSMAWEPLTVMTVMTVRHNLCASLLTNGTAEHRQNLWNILLMCILGVYVIIFEEIMIWKLG